MYDQRVKLLKELNKELNEKIGRLENKVRKLEHAHEILSALLAAATLNELAETVEKQQADIHAMKNAKDVEVQQLNEMFKKPSKE